NLPILLSPRNLDIIHGEKAPENSMQYMASLQDKEGGHVCGGFLITQDFVVSAAHWLCSQPNSGHVTITNSTSNKLYIFNQLLFCNHIF
uniref:Peptidase S1 domain-containing protein n=1 Tax=Neolamprologus brichardi TaxID=32507 RepID=A0A3Q4MJ79_NEOBR